MALYNVIGDFPHRLVSKAIIKLLSAVIEGRDTEEDKPSASHVFFGKGEQLPPNAFVTFGRCDSDGSDVRRASKTVRVNQDKSCALPFFMCHEQFTPGPAKGQAASFEVKAQGEPGLTSRHKLSAPVEIGFLRRLDADHCWDVLQPHKGNL